MTEPASITGLTITAATHVSGANNVLPEGFDSEPKPRRHWRVTKADLEAQVVAAAEAAERRAAECAELRGQVFVAEQRAARVSRANRQLAMIALAGWAAFAVAVVW